MRHNHNSIIIRKLYGDFSYARVHNPDRIAGWIQNSRRIAGIDVIAPNSENHILEFFGIGLNFAPEVGAGIIFFFDTDQGNGFVS